MTFFKSLDYFYKEQIMRGNSPNTIKDYQNKLRYALEFFGDVDVSYFDVGVCGDYLFWLKSNVKNTVSLQSYIRSFRAYLNYLYLHDYIKEDICHRFKLPKARKSLVRVLSDEDLCKILDTFDKTSDIGFRNYVIFVFFLDSGIRLSEICNLKRSDVNLKERYAYIIGKGNKCRYVSFGILCASLLKQYFSTNDSDYAFVCADERPLTVSALKNMFRKLKISSGVSSVHAHLLRHTFSTRYLENGGHVYELKELLGHSTLRMTQNYLHVAQTRISKDFELYSPLDKIIGVTNKDSHPKVDMWCSCGESNSGHLD